ncbi:MAG: bifunctional oligoribonuclease/PAP phosphatase NrnA [Calditrichaeota bacterium]|nr:MAG: bifunctional oligoribonuclease/PAP phosphatase NrnA [Calditrichota bacterium]
MQKTHIEQIAQIIEQNQRFVLTTHANPDGDGIGSEMALFHYLRNKGKDVTVLNVDRSPENLQFLEKDYPITIFQKPVHSQLIEQADIIFVLDISDWKRLRELGEVILETAAETVCIDHHILEEPFANKDYIFASASSTGELIYDLLSGLGADLNIEICEAILTAVIADTGCFRFSNTSPKVFQIAAEMQARGADRVMIYQQLYESQGLPRIRLLARVLNNLRLDCNGKIAWMEISQKMLKQTGSSIKDTEGLSDFPRRIQGVEIALLFMELPDGKVKISFRSKGRIVINKLAAKFMGGGHAFAAGAAVDGALADVRDDVLFHARYLFE